MRYTVTRRTETGETLYLAGNLSRRSAIIEAKSAAGKYPSDNIFVSWYRSNDGQHGYLNPTGDHAIVGDAW